MSPRSLSARPLFAAVLGAVLVLAGPTGCALWGMEGGPGGSGIEPPAATTPDASTAVLGIDGVQRVEVALGDDLRFRPAVVRARPGIIELTFRNVGATPHDVELPPVATGNLNGGQTSTVRVSIDTPGRYPFPCRYHVSSGMTGTLDITTPHITTPPSADHDLRVMIAVRS